MIQSDSTPTASNLAYVEMLYEQYLQDPGSVDPVWRRQFEQWRADSANSSPASASKSTGNGNGNGQGKGHNVRQVASAVFRTNPSFRPRSIFHPPPASRGGTVLRPGVEGGVQAAGRTENDAALQHKVDKLVRNYRVRGHIAAKVDPLGFTRPMPDEMDPGYYGFTAADMDRQFYTQLIPGGDMHSLREIIDHLNETYCRHIGAQFMHIDDLHVREWLQSRMESSQNKITLSRREQLRILTKLTDAVIFEEFVQNKFLGAKSFSLEGAESLIPLLDRAFEKAGEQNAREIVIGMAHRGRLNVLANIIGKSPQKIFREFEDKDPMLYIGGGDVKYHLGYSGEWTTRTGKRIHLSLCFNPSHLEFVNPVALGRMRAKQDRSGLQTRGEGGVVFLIHGDAAFIGEGVAQETLNLSQLPGYTVGGTVHIVVNNQLGFTTGEREGRSCPYATDIAKMLQSPIFHVNGENPEAVAQVIELALDFRLKFKRDVVIDMYCYRKRGHNEGDEPSYTQPLMYRKIRERPGVRDSYLNSILKMGSVTQDDADRIARRRTEVLEHELTAARSEDYVVRPQGLEGPWNPYAGEGPPPPYSTKVDESRLRELLEKLTEMPEGFNPHPKLKRWLNNRYKQSQGEVPIDWAAAEALAFATLLTEGAPVRISGQDSQRGTFSHRHGVLHDHETGDSYTPLANLAADQARVELINSPLSENAVLGFDYGYSLDMPEGLVIWEAQFGDFANVAQVIIDQFIASAEDKWRRLSGLVMLLPHGFEGMGPEHSSARLERFLAMCAEDNMQVAQPSTPAQMFHLLRRQVVRLRRKPLVVMTPKSLLRHPQVISSLDELAEGQFDPVLIDDWSDSPKKVKRILMCSGRIYYDLAKRREELERTDVAILRLEQFYPFPTKRMEQVLSAYNPKVELVYVQDEPANMGAWPFLKALSYHMKFAGPRMRAVARKVSSSPATGSKAAHMIELEELLRQAYAGL